MNRHIVAQPSAGRAAVDSGDFPTAQASPKRTFTAGQRITSAADLEVMPPNTVIRASGEGPWRGESSFFRKTETGQWEDLVRQRCFPSTVFQGGDTQDWLKSGEALADGRLSVFSPPVAEVELPTSNPRTQIGRYVKRFIADAEGRFDGIYAQAFMLDRRVTRAQVSAELLANMDPQLVAAAKKAEREARGVSALDVTQRMGPYRHHVHATWAVWALWAARPNDIRIASSHFEQEAALKEIGRIEPKAVPQR